MKIFSAMFLAIIAIYYPLFANAPDTLHLQADGKDIPIPYSLQTNKATHSPTAAWDTSTTTPLPSWRAMETVAKSFDDCKKDWNSLLTLNERKDSLCKASLAASAHQSELQAERTTNYESSWNELLATQKQCSQALSTCTNLGKEQATQLEKASRSYWWAWLASGIFIGLMGGVVIGK